MRLEHGVVKIDFKRNAESIIRVKPGPLVIQAYFQRFENADETLGGTLLLNTSRLNKENEGAGTAVHDWNFGIAQIYVGVVDAQARKGRHQVLHG